MPSSHTQFWPGRKPTQPVVTGVDADSVAASVLIIGGVHPPYWHTHSALGGVPGHAARSVAVGEALTVGRTLAVGVSVETKVFGGAMIEPAVGVQTPL